MNDKLERIEALNPDISKSNKIAEGIREQVDSSVAQIENKFIDDDPDFLERVFRGALEDEDRLREADRQDWSTIADCLDGVGNHANSFYPDSED